MMSQILFFVLFGIAFSQGVFSPFDAAYDAEHTSSEYIAFKTTYHMRASAYDADRYSCLHNSILEDVCLELLEETGVDFKDKREKYLSFLLRDFTKVFYTQSYPEMRSKTANIIKLLVADQSMNNFTQEEPITANHLRIIYKHAKQDALYNLAYNHLWRQIKSLAFQEHTLNYFVANFNPTCVNFKRILYLKVENVAIIFSPIVDALERHQPATTNETLKEIAITLLKAPYREINLSLLQRIFLMLKRMEIQLDPETIFYLADSVLKNLEFLSLIPQDFEFKTGDTMLTNIAYGAMYQVYTENSAYFQRAEPITSSMTVCMQRYRIFNRTVERIPEIIDSFKNIEDFDIDEITIFGAPLMILKSAYYILKELYPEEVFQLARASLPIYMYAKEQVALIRWSAQRETNELEHSIKMMRMNNWAKLGNQALFFGQEYDYQNLSLNQIEV